MNVNTSKTNMNASSLILSKTKNKTKSKTEVEINDKMLTIVVLSARDHKGHRDVIRQTWKTGHANVHFIVGKHFCKYPPPSRHSYTCDYNGKNVSNGVYASYYKKEAALTKQIESETDVIMVEMVDVYRNLAKKLKLAYKWVYENVKPAPKYILKVDEDTFVRVGSVEKWLSQRANPDLHDSYEIIAGDFSGGGVARSGKWAENKYKKSSYPLFPSGAGHIINAKTLKLIMDNYDKFVTYQGEDTSLGIFFDELKVNSKILVNLRRCNHFITHSGNCLDKSKFVVGHDIKWAMMKRCYTAMDEW
jgi:hypothetical protein